MKTEEETLIDLHEVIEIEECHLVRANQLLAAGYSLLDLAQSAWEAPRRKKDSAGNETFIRRDFKYVVGRIEGQPSFPPAPPKDERKPAGEQA